MTHSSPSWRREPTIDERLDGLLIDWYEHFRGYRYGTGAGHRSESATTADYRTPGHMDWANGAADERADRLMLESMNECIEKIPNAPERWRTALEFNARNLHQGITVWYSPVLPATKEERDVLILEARNRLLVLLKTRNLIE